MSRKSKTARKNRKTHAAKRRAVVRKRGAAAPKKAPKVASRTRTTLHARRRAAATTVGVRLSAAARRRVTKVSKHALGFRLSAQHDRLLRQKQRAMEKEGDPNANRSVLRTLLVTHLLLGNESISTVTFSGGYSVRKKTNAWTLFANNKAGERFEVRRGAARGWAIVDGDGTVHETGLTFEEASSGARDLAILRAEWESLRATGSVETEVRRFRQARPAKTTRAKEHSKGLRLSPDIRLSLERLASANGTNVSLLLRSFLTAQLVQRRKRLLEVTFGPYRVSPATTGWLIEGAGKRIACKTLDEAFSGVEMLLQGQIKAA